MDPAIKKVWTDALRSGDYQQGQGQLVLHHRDGSGILHCCLGVLCALAVQAGVKGIALAADGTFRAKDPSLDEWETPDAVLPSVVAEWAQLGFDPELPDGRSLIQMNDNFGMNFSEIASAIEEGL